MSKSISDMVWKAVLGVCIKISNEVILTWKIKDK